MTLGQLLLFLSEASSAIGDGPYAAFVGLALYILGFETGPGPIFHVMASELFVASVRPMGISIGVLGLYICTILVVYLYLPLTDAITETYTFLIFLIISALVLIVSIFAVPETKGKSIDGPEESSPSSSPSSKDDDPSQSLLSDSSKPVPSYSA